MTMCIYVDICLAFLKSEILPLDDPVESDSYGRSCESRLGVHQTVPRPFLVVSYHEVSRLKFGIRVKHALHAAKPVTDSSHSYQPGRGNLLNGH